jgi:cbb3-type cytochrome oxidase cytochrome c subunit
MAQQLRVEGAPDPDEFIANAQEEMKDEGEAEADAEAEAEE